MPWKAIYTAVSLTSMGLLILELSLTRIFSVVFFYHFGFLAISIALFGLGRRCFSPTPWRAGLDAYSHAGLAQPGEFALRSGRAGGAVNSQGRNGHASASGGLLRRRCHIPSGARCGRWRFRKQWSA